MGLFGCQSKKADPKPGPVGEKTTTAAPDPAPDPDPQAAPELYTPTTAVPPTTVTAPPGSCDPLPATPKDADAGRKHAAALAGVIRRLSCEPELYAKSALELSETLELPEDITVSFSGPTSVRVETPSWPRAKVLADALGIKEPAARLHWNAYHDQWYLASDPETGGLDLFEPGNVTIMVSHDADRDDPMGKIVSVTDDMDLGGVVFVSMPEGTVTMAVDPEGLKQMVAAMEVLAADPTMMAKQPEEVAKQLGLEGERFRVAGTSLHRGDTKINGISIQPMRTRIEADALAKALGLENARAVNTNREHDVWNVEVGGTTQLSWRGIRLEIDVDVADGGDRHTTLAGAEAGFISMMPAEAAQ